MFLRIQCVGKENVLSSCRLTLYVAVARGRTKLPLFVFMKGQPGGWIEKQSDKLFPTGVYGLCKPNAWMEKIAMRIWYEKAYKPSISVTTAESGITLDDYICFKDSDLIECMKQENTICRLMRNHYNAELQPCDVSISKSLKDLLNRSC